MFKKMLEEIQYTLECIWDERAKIIKVLNAVVYYMIPILLVMVLITHSTPKVEQLVVNYTIEESEEIVTSAETDEVPLGKAIKEVIKTQCNLRGVDQNLVYAIINSADVEDGEYRIGIMKLHPDLRQKYDKHMGKGPGVVESIYSNAVAGIDRLKWCFDTNASFEGAMMVYVYTKPVAQEMWAQDIVTTEWIESIKEAL